MANDIQQQADLEQAKAKLQEVAEVKEGRKENRVGETSLIARHRQENGERIPDEERDIKAGTVKPKKKKFRQKLKEAMFAEDIGNGSVTEYIFFKVIVPSVKQVVYNAANTALCMALNLDPKTNRVIGSGNTHTSNASLYNKRASGEVSSYNGRKRPLSEDEWDEDTAKDYFNQMLEIVEKYDDLSISNVYSICGLQERIRTTDRYWGWTKALMSRADVYPVDRFNDRWVIDLPEPRPLR